MATVVILALLVLWVAVLSRWGRRAPSPVESVERQHRALHALHSVSERARGSRAASASARHRPSAESPRVPKRIGAREQAHVITPPATAAPVRPRPSRRATLAVAVAVVAGTIAAMAIRGTPSSRPSSARSSPRAAAGTATSTTGVPTTTTGAPALKLIGSDDRQAVFTLPLDRFRVTVAASGPCWLQVRAGASGAVLLEDTLVAGDTRTFDAAGSLWLRLGDSANVTVLADNGRVEFPGRPATPYDLSFAGPSGES